MGKQANKQRAAIIVDKVQDELGRAGASIGELRGKIAADLNAKMADVGQVVTGYAKVFDGTIGGELADAGDIVTNLQRRIRGYIDGKSAELQAVASRLDIPGPALVAKSPPIVTAEMPLGIVDPNAEPAAEMSGSELLTAAGITGIQPAQPLSEPTDEPPITTPPTTPPTPNGEQPAEPPTETETETDLSFLEDCVRIVPCDPKTGQPTKPTYDPAGGKKANVWPFQGPPTTSDPGEGVKIPPQETPEPKPGLDPADILCGVDAYQDFFKTRMAMMSQAYANVGEGLGMEKTPGGVYVVKPIGGNMITNVITSAMANVWGSIIDGVEWWLKRSPVGSACITGENAGLWASRIVADVIAQYVSSGVGELALPLTYATRKNCTTGFPSSDQAIGAFLANEIQTDTLKTWGEINNQCWEPFKRVMRANRTKINAQELLTLRLREFISEGEYAEKMRELGFIDDDDPETLYKLTEQIPPVSELIRFMVRDVADEGLVTKFGMMDDFPKKWVGDVKEWSLKQGVQQNFAEASWKAHWQLPGATQLFEMMHRLRDHPDVTNVRTTAETIETALKQDDVMPYWVPRLMAISFKPLSRIDIRRAFNIGSITRAQVKEGNTQLGYSDENAEIMTKFAVDLRNRRAPNELTVRLWVDEAIDKYAAAKRLKMLGYPNAVVTDTLNDAEARLDNNWAIRLYARFQIDKDEARQRMKVLGIRDFTITKWLARFKADLDKHPAIAEYERGIINRLDALTQLNDWSTEPLVADMLLVKTDHIINLKFNGDCINAIENKFALGEINEPQARQELLMIGTSSKYVEGHIREFKCKQQSKGKMPSTEKLCAWFEMGLLNQVDYFDRLKKIGWNDADATRILIQCAARINLKVEKAAEKAAKQQLAAENKRAQLLKRAGKELERKMKERGRAVEKSKKTKDRRDANIIKCAEKLVKKSEMELTEAFTIVRTLNRELQEEYVISADDAIASVCKGIESPQFPDELPLEELARQFAQSFAELDTNSFKGNGYRTPG